MMKQQKLNKVTLTGTFLVILSLALAASAPTGGSSSGTPGAVSTDTPVAGSTLPAASYLPASTLPASTLPASTTVPTAHGRHQYSRSACDRHPIRWNSGDRIHRYADGRNDRHTGFFFGWYGDQREEFAIPGELPGG